MGIDKSIRIRVNIDARKPLMRSVKIKMRGGMEEFFDVRYERPPLSCYFCGKIGHDLKDCEICQEQEDPPLLYGSSIKASSWKYHREDSVNRVSNSEGTCARSLFTIKPKPKIGMAEKTMAKGVMSKLTQCTIKGTEDDYEGENRSLINDHN